MRRNDGEWYYCLQHRRVESPDGCKDVERLGPYPTMAEAERAADLVVHHEARERRGRTHDRSWDEEMWDDGT